MVISASPLHDSHIATSLNPTIGMSGIIINHGSHLYLPPKFVKHFSGLWDTPYQGQEIIFILGLFI
jgi:hypothetical protein